MRKQIHLWPFLLLVLFFDNRPVRAAESGYSVLQEVQSPTGQEFGTYPLHVGSDSELAILDSGEGSFQARVESVREAKRSIRVQTLLLTGDESGLFFAQELIQKRQEGLSVRVIIDLHYAGKTKATRVLLHDLEANGIEVVGFDPATYGVRPNLALYHDGIRLNKRLHEKIWLVDAETPKTGVGIIGGLNIANEYFRVGFDTTRIWRDQDVLVRGDVLGDIAQSFDENFERLTRHYRTVEEWNEEEITRFRDENAKLHRRGKHEINVDPGVSEQMERILSDYQTPEALPATMRYLRSRP
ncbi:MAG: phospholipase D-like domain-containing protein, partial [Bdellovibrionota bacterium]